MSDREKHIVLGPSVYAFTTKPAIVRRCTDATARLQRYKHREDML